MSRHLARWWVVLVVLVVAAGAEWLRRPAWAWVGLVWLLTAALLAALEPWTRAAGWRRRTLAAAVAGAALVLAGAQRELTSIERSWPDEREARVDAASRNLSGDLHSAFHLAERLAYGALRVAPGDDPGGAMEALRRLLPGQGPEAGIAILEADGVPWAWAGRHRLRPMPQGDSIATRASGYYVVLETRRHSANGRVVVASVLIWAHPAVPERDRSLAELFRRRTEVGLAVYPAGTAPDSPDVFDYEEPTTAGPRLLFSVQPIPPEQGTAKERVLERAGRVGTWLILAAVAVALALAGLPTQRFALLSALLWLVVRAPLGDALSLKLFLSKATYFHPLLGPLSASAGLLALSGALITMLGIWLGRQARPRRVWGVAIGVALLFLTPYVVSALGRGITPPAGGAPIPLWLVWQLALMLAATALIVAAAVLFRGAGAEGGAIWRIGLAVALALAASVVGIFVWQPQGGWPEWYPFLWTPALVLVALPAPRWATICGIAVVAGSAAGLVTWGAEVRGRLQVAQRDVGRLGDEPDPLTIPQLDRFADRMDAAAQPRTTSQLYALWHGSSLARQDYPAALALWTRSGRMLAELPLDSLDLPAALLSSLVRDLGARRREVVPVLRVPGVHYVLVTRLDSATVLTVAVGPRTELIVRGRLGRLLEVTQRGTPAYRLSLSPPQPPTAERQRLRWRREGWSVRGVHGLTLPDGVRQVHAVVDLRSPLPLLVRGALVVLLDVGALALLWWLAEAAAGAPIRPPRWRALGRSFRLRLAFTLGAFFVVPAAGFAAWGFARLGDEAERARDLLITQTLRDAVLSAASLYVAPGTPVEPGLGILSRRLDADLALYDGGALAATSTPILLDLGVITPLMDPRAFRSLALEGELEVTRPGANRGIAERVGYRVLEPGPPETIGVLATTQLADESGLAVRQLDLALVLLLATLMGAAAAVAGARAAARTLSRPVSELRRSALALGQGRPMPPPAHSPPLEFEPVFGAFERMAADIRGSQQALEEARRRTATVLATVATGVVGLDGEGRVLIANPRAVDLLGVALREGEPLLGALDADWQPLEASVRAFLANGASGEAATELTIGPRRLALQLASLGPALGGVVLALNDVTELSRAERVLAWGDMARQVAHEIKNPLTPMRLGMQHLMRVHRDRRGDFDRVLGETAERILAEIDRLDTIARAFSRFAAPGAESAQLERVDLAATAREVVQLYRLAGEGAEVRLEAPETLWGAARRDEVKEVLVNLLENARNAGARTITVTVAPNLLVVADDGSGIPAELLPRIFEPRFSTTTSGSGLGLSIVRRLVESWGGRIDVESGVTRGTVATVRLAGQGSGFAIESPSASST